MHRASRVAFVCGALAALVAASVAAQGQQVYRYVDKDGRVVYSDRVPPADSKDVQTKRVTPNFIETNTTPLATLQAQERFPVTLYTFACGEFCQNAEALLNRRGVPFAVVNVEDPKGAERLQKLTGELQAPVLQVGDKLVAKGYNEARWHAMLDEAGYPKTPPSRRATPVRAPGAPPATLPTEPVATRADAPPQSAVPSGGYPKE
jgi:glutaredoxin